jgi:hypothetical protein
VMKFILLGFCASFCTSLFLLFLMDSSSQYLRFPHSSPRASRVP